MLRTEHRNRYTIIGLLAGSLFLYYLLNTISVAGGADLNRKLSFYNTHTREHLTVIYKKGDYYVPESLEKIKDLFKIAQEVKDLLTEVGNHGEVHIISGYRAPKTNTKLRKRSKGVAAGSLHMKGKALDFRLPGNNTAVLRDKALTMKRGGVGYYKKSNFIQIDTGRVRRW